MDIASGLHTRLTSVPGLAEKAEKLGRRLIDVRHPTREFDVGRGVKRTGKRLLTVGTDTSVGKMFTSLAIEREMKRRGMKATFRATGQTGRSEEHTSALQSLMRISYAVFCFKQHKPHNKQHTEEYSNNK